MTKKKILLLIAIICGIGLLIYISSYLSNSSRLEHISKKIEINLENCKIEKEKDTHGGFLGDGDYFAKIICNTQIDNKIKSEWNKLPLPDELQKVMNIIQYDNKGGHNVYDKYNIPNLENGYYYFLDRHTESKDKKSDKELNQRSSYNFSVAIYDDENKILYYYALDT